MLLHRVSLTTTAGCNTCSPDVSFCKRRKWVWFQTLSLSSHNPKKVPSQTLPCPRAVAFSLSFPFWHCFYKSSLHPRCCKQTSNERGESLAFKRMQWMTHKRPSAHHFLPHAFFAFSVAPRAHEVRWGIYFRIPVLYRSTPKRTKTELCVC